ncbi:class III poly(R)-hydroxyalkanoic acid synthase subunit PhaC [Haloferula sp.]|uniref:class III poly(R)-hydroxyalkanoic acid synthase subunit PhaC n=1 Tax=Haloferula sp. TaxID=2497595 RepID=UPI003C746F94
MQTANPWAAAHQAILDETTRNLERFKSLPTVLEKAKKVKKGATPSEVVYEEDSLKLLHYISDKPVKHKTPMIFVFALVNRPYILDLMPNKSVVSHFVDAGYDTYLIDWGAPKHSDRHLTLDSYVNGYLYNVVEQVQARTGAKKVNILGYCMGGGLSSMFTSLHQDKVKNLMLLAAGIDFTDRTGLLNLWSDKSIFDVDSFVDAFGNCPAEFLQGSFLMLNPIGNFIQKPLAFMENLDNEKYLEDFLTMETWLNDNIPVAGEIYREYVKYLYQENRLVKGTLPVGRHVIDLKNITCPVLNIMATRDDLVPCAQSKPFNDLVGSKDKEILELNAGHIGLAVGSRAQRELWPDVVKWLSKRD